MTDSPGPGRPTGRPDTRTRILDAALESFVSKGFQGTSLRGVAGAVGVDDGTVRHHFGDKLGLLMASLRVSMDPRQLVSRVTADGTDGLGPRIIATALRVYDSPIGTALKQALDAHPQTAQLMTGVMIEQISRQADILFADTSPAVRRERLAVLQTVMTGLAASRLIVRSGPLAELPNERIVALLGPVLQAAIDGRLDRP